jgi:hypothetical protein
LKHSLEELEAKNREVTLLDKQVKDLEQKLQLSDAKITERVCLHLFPTEVYVYTTTAQKENTQAYTNLCIL